MVQGSGTLALHGLLSDRPELEEGLGKWRVLEEDSAGVGGGWPVLSSVLYRLSALGNQTGRIT